MRKEKSRQKAWFYMLAFAIPVLAGIWMYRIKGIAPFGENSILNMDLWGQYFPMYVQQFKNAEGSELLYSWNGGLGYNNWAQSAYYTNSALLFLLKFVPMDMMLVGLDLICLLKIALSSVACFAFLDRKPEKNPWAELSGAVSYSLCGYALAFLTQPMWTDALIYTPLILIGIDRLLYRKKGVWYTLMLAACIMSSFYIGFAVCIFSGLWFLTELADKGATVKEKTGSLLRFTLYSLLAGGLSAFVILPVGAAISRTMASDIAGPTGSVWYFTGKKLLTMLLPAQTLKLAYSNSGVNIFTGLLVFLLVPLFFLNPDIPVGRRISKGLLTAVLLLSMSWNRLEYVWHGFHVPNQLPGRWTFLFSLTAACLCTEGLVHRKGIRLIPAFLSVAAGVLAFGYGTGWMKETVLPAHYVVMLAAACVLLVLAAALSKAPAHGRIRMLQGLSIGLVACIQLVSSCISFGESAALDPGGMGVSALESYSTVMQKFHRTGMEWEKESPYFYRSEPNSGYTFNPSMFGDLHGMSYYSSTMVGEAFSLFRFLGNRVYADKVSTVYNLSSPVQNGLWGISRYMDYSHNLSSNLPGAKEKLQESEDVDVYANPTALPPAYAVSDNALSWEVTRQVRAIRNQESFLDALTGETNNVYTQMNTSAFSYENCSLQENSDWDANYYIRADSSRPVSIHYRYVCEQAGPVFLESNYRAGTLTAAWEGGHKDVNTGTVKFAYLGVFAPGDEIRIEFSADKVNVGCCGLNLYRFDEERWNEAFQKLNRQSLNVTEYNGNRFSGQITMEDEGLVLATLIQDGGWQILCDGEPAETSLVGGILPAVRIPAGEHTLEYRYEVRGLKAGLLISTLSGLFLTGCFFFCKKKP